MIPWRLFWLIVILAALGLFSLAGLGDAQDRGDYLVMDRSNLTIAESYLKIHGHQVTAHEGVVLGELAAREIGTGTAAVRGRDKNGAWFWWVWQTQKGVMVRLKKYPARPPQALKGD